ncbi:exodeoxyribonuclease V beta subunit [Kineococcus radiotolerans]|uniref:RecBCD enzyme subunit RecB n=1 Tax=Kineococcus radiotolerans TaxID=131568 RepID=A0A7W4TK04_KINRA|nr:UvrD-helicase domain-containing protein [Kineococcus radiotolerans]MBB2900324.1 exodeoxyribonuclease V beta subunit [Kineococcus radiotolerans]
MSAATPAPAVFDLAGPLPLATTVLEASAGTGKTYTIAGLVTRYVAEGVATVDQLLVVTFGRAATAELRDRVRERLVATRDALADPASARRSRDAVLAHLAADDARAAEHRARLSEALAGFDTATVATIHEFCRQVLTSLGTAADVDPSATLVEDVDDLVEEVCDDLYLRFAVRPGAGVPPFDRPTALRIARAAVERADARIEPPDTLPGSPENLRVRFALGVRREVEARKRSRRVLGFDDLLTRLRDALTDPVAGPVACERLRRRYSVVLVDEFQDTDAVQWDVLRTAFHGQGPLVLIGDPKQAIYAFRGADVRSYLDAAGVAGTTATLSTNHRSDPLVLAGTAALLRGAALGEQRIVVRPVDAAHAAAALVDGSGAPDPAPVRVRVLGRDGLPTTGKGLPPVGEVRAVVARDTAAQVVAVLREGLRVRPRDGGERDLEAGDVAVLVRTGAQAALVQEELRRRGVPCVLSRGPSVFATPAAQEWISLLEAVEQPHRAPRVRRVALSSFVGRTAAELDAAGDRATDELSVQLREWGAVLAERGVAGAFAVVGEAHRLPGRLLGVEGGERRLTDLRHIAEVLHRESALNPGGGVSSLLSWLRARVEEAAGDADRERSRRLDTDRAAVQIATVHTSKGLEFEVVCVPFGWDAPGGGGSKDRLPVAHAPDGPRALHVGGPGAPGYAAACRAADTEDLGEELRLLYVAVTRAVSRLLVWWAPSQNTEEGALHRLLLAEDPLAVPESVPVPGDEVLRSRLASRFPAGGPVAVETVPLRTPEDRLPAVAAPAAHLAVARFRGAVDLGWRRTSYSGLTRGVHDGPGAGHAVLAGPEVDVTDDEVDLDAAGATAADDDPRGWRATVSPMADLPAGTGFGTLVHAVLEGFDPAVPDRTAHLAALAREQFDPQPAEDLALALGPVLRTGLGPLAGGAALEGFPVADRLAELDFEMPLAGGDAAGPVGPRVGDVAGLLRRHLPPGDPVHRYADALEDPVLGEEGLRGYLTGSIDAVLRRRGGGFLVVDYKTNRLGAPGETLTAWHYRREALDEAVLAAHYPLQALLYCVALHRFLRWRQPGYDPAVHLGGVLYLFLRGMCGPEVPAGEDGVPPGVWSWRPPAGLVVDLSELLAGRTP